MGGELKSGGELLSRLSLLEFCLGTNYCRLFDHAKRFSFNHCLFMYNNINLDLSILYKIITSNYCQLLEIKGTAIFIIVLLVYFPEPNASNIAVTLSLDLLIIL